MAIITRDDTGEQYDDTRAYTAWELCADDWWSALGYTARVIGGRVDWEDAANFGGNLVRLQRLEGGDSRGPRQYTRYVDPNTVMHLCPSKWTDRNLKELGYSKEVQ